MSRAGLAGQPAYRRDTAHGLMFHRFHAASGVSEWQGALTPTEFEQVIQYVGVERLLSPEEWTSRTIAGTLRNEDLCITFDDGLRSQAEFALPVLRRLGLRAFWFVYTSVLEGSWVKSEIYSFVGGQLPGGMDTLIRQFLGSIPAELLAQLQTPEFEAYQRQMRRVAPFYTDADLRYRFIRNQPTNDRVFERVMDGILVERGFSLADVGRQLWMERADLAMLAADGHAVGLHSHTHAYQVGMLDAQEQRREYARNCEAITDVTGVRPQSMSHPLNSYNSDTLEILSDLGIQCGFRANMAAVNGRGLNPTSLEIAREDAANIIALLNRPTHPNP